MEKPQERSKHRRTGSDLSSSLGLTASKSYRDAAGMPLIVCGQLWR